MKETDITYRCKNKHVINIKYIVCIFTVILMSTVILCVLGNTEDRPFIFFGFLTIILYTYILTKITVEKHKKKGIIFYEDCFGGKNNSRTEVFSAIPVLVAIITPVYIVIPCILCIVIIITQKF